MVDPSQITTNSLKNIDLKEVALDEGRLGGLKFENAWPMIKRMQDYFVELDELGYQKELENDDDLRQIDSLRERLVALLQRIAAFNPGINANDNKTTHDNLEREVDGIFRETSRAVRLPLLYLRNELARKSSDQQSIEFEQKAAKRAREKSEEILGQLQQKLEQITEREQRIATGHEKIATMGLALHFESEARKYGDEVKKWFKWGCVVYGTIILFVGGNFIYHWWKGWDKITLQEGVAKVIIFAAMWYVFAFVIKNYNVSSHLSSVNRHRSAVARTLEDFLATDDPRKAEMLENGTEAMFKHAPIGYITKAEKESNSPIFEIVNQILGKGNS